MRWHWLSLPKLPWMHCSSLGMDKGFQLTLYWANDYLTMLELKLIHINNTGAWGLYYWEKSLYLNSNPWPSVFRLEWVFEFKIPIKTTWTLISSDHEFNGPFVLTSARLGSISVTGTCMLKSLVSWWSHSSKIPALHLDCTIAIGGGVWVGMEWTMPSYESFQQVSCAGLGTDSTNHSQRTIHFHTKFEKMKHHKNNIKSFLTRKAPTHGWWWV